MPYALVHYPMIDTRLIDQFREIYDPQAGLIRPHITVVFPVPEIAAELAQRTILVSHIRGVLGRWQPFGVRLRGLQPSADNYLFLLVEEGKKELIRLHDELYTGPLTQYLREDLPFVPHMTLGAFGDDRQAPLKALDEAERLDLDFQAVLNRLHFLRINDDGTRIISSEEYNL
jgi:2'-5' RNA ligase